MKKFAFNFILVLVLFFVATILQAQQTQTSKQLPLSTTSSTQNLKTIQNEFYSYWESHEQDAIIYNENEENEEHQGYNQFKRWEWLMKSRTFPTGNLPDPFIAARERDHYLKAHPEVNTIRNATWQTIGNNTVPSNGGGAGRINVIRFDPVTPSTFYIGCAGGGIWKTTDGGATWNPIGDQLPVTSIADIAVDPLNTNIIYVATGDGYGYEATWQSDQDFWGGVYAAGILKSTDGGNTWATTGLSFDQDSLEIVQRMLIHPTNPDILVAATRNGIYRSADAGDNWTLVDTTHCYDMAFNTANPDIIYAGGNQDILYSTDAGATWSILKNNLGGLGRVSIETTPLNPDVIYALFESSYQLFKSSDGGVTWANKTSPSAGFYGYYDMVLALSPTDEGVLLAGGLSVVKSENSGQSWQSISDYNFPASDYVHADNHALAFDPIGEQTIYSGNDGGIFKSANLGNTWTDLSNGLNVAQIYRLSSSATNPDIITSGWQDNGCNLWNGTDWKQIYGADGMETIVDFTDPDILYEETQYGGLSKSTNGGTSWQSISPGGGNWLTSYVMDPLDHQKLYYGGISIFKTTNGGSNWSNVGNIFNGDYCYAIAIAPSNTDYVYASSLDKIFVTSAGGNPWTNISAGLPNDVAGMNYIAVSNNNPLSVWVVFSGYVAGEKVYHSTDGGSTWINVSGSLPNIPVNTIVYENDSPDGVYIGTDIGVFYMDNTLTDWVPYNAGLPNVMVHELEINYTSDKLLAATYGRGIWESDLYYTVQYANDMGALSVLEPTNEVCSTSIDPVVKVKNFGTGIITSFAINYSIDSGSLLTYTWNGSLTSLASITISLPTITGVAVGPHTFTASTSNPNGSSDNNLANDEASSSFTVIGSGASLPFEEGFESGVFPPVGWLLDNANDLWSLTNTASGFGNSINSAMADFYHTNSGSDYLTSPYLNFTDAIPPVKLKFSVAYAKKNSIKTDTLKVAVSADCGQTYDDVYVKGGTDLATAPDLTGSAFVPTSAQWRDEIVDLTDYDTYDKVLIRFEAKTDHGNDMYLDDINLYGLSTGITAVQDGEQISVYPNPSNGEFTISIVGGTANDIIIELFNVLGQKIQELNGKKTGGIETYPLHLLVKANGVYVVKVKTNNQTFTQSLVVQN